MTSVKSASERSQADEQIRKTRESYSERETEQTKKQKAEIRRLTEQHAIELDKLQAGHAKQLEEIKDSTKEAISSKEMRFQKEINDVRDVYQKKMMQSALDSEQSKTRSEETLKKQNESNMVSSEQQKLNLRKTFEEQIAERDRLMREVSEQSRQTSQKQNLESTNKLNEKHAQETNALIADRDRRVGAGQQNYEKLRKTKDFQLSEQERLAGSQLKSISQKFENVINNDRTDSQIAQESLRTGFGEDIRRNQDRYNKALEANREGLETARDQLNTSANSRIDTQVNFLEGQTQKAKMELARQRMQMATQKQREVDNLREQFQNNLEVSEKNRTEFVDDVNRKTQLDIDRLNKKNADSLTLNNRFYLDKETQNEMRTAEKFDQQKDGFHNEKEHLLTATQSRFDRYKSAAEIEKQRNKSYFEGAETSLRENFDTTLREMRLRNKQEQDQLFKTMAKQATDNDRSFQEKLSNTIDFYEKQLQNQHDKHQREFKDYQIETARRMKEEIKKGSFETEKVQSAGAYKISKLEETHRREMAEVQKKHQTALEYLSKQRQQG